MLSNRKNVLIELTRLNVNILKIIIDYSFGIENINVNAHKNEDILESILSVKSIEFNKGLFKNAIKSYSGLLIKCITNVISINYNDYQPPLFYRACRDNQYEFAKILHKTFKLTKEHCLDSNWNNFARVCYHGNEHFVEWLCNTFEMTKWDCLVNNGLAIAWAFSCKQYHILHWFEVKFGLTNTNVDCILKSNQSLLDRLTDECDDPEHGIILKLTDRVNIIASF